MRSLYHLISPRILGLINGLKRSESRGRKKAWTMIAAGLVFWGLMFFFSCRVLLYFQSIEIVGNLLARHLLSIVLLTFFSLLIFSHVITALSNLFLSNDLELCHASPADPDALFLSRAFYTVLDSSWMVVVFGLPVLMAYAWVYSPGIGYYVSLVHLGCGLIIIAAGAGILVTVILVNIFPAHRTRDVVMLLVIFLIVALYILFRFLRPERLVDPEAFFSVMQYLNALKAPDSPYLPTHWVSETLWSHLSGAPGNRHNFQILLTWSTALALIVINVWVAGVLYFSGFSKSQEAKRRRRAGRTLLNLFLKGLTKPMGGDLSSIIEKDIRMFFRDNTQWSQLLLLGALVVVYLYNFSVLPLERSPIRIEYLQNNIAFLNIGLAGFVLSAVSVRFIFPAVSGEGGSYWIIRSSPLSLKRLLWGKFAMYLIPMVFLAETLIIVTNHLLQVNGFMMLLSVFTILMVVFGIVGLGIGLGAMYPNFGHQNIAQVSTGFGGVMYMMVASLFIALVVVLEAGPAYIVFMAHIKGRGITGLQWLYIALSFIAVLAINFLATFRPMKMGLKALEAYE